MNPFRHRPAAARAKQVTAASVAVAAAGAMYGVSHDGRGGAAPAETIPAATTTTVSAPVASTSVPVSVLGGATTTLAPADTTVAAAGVESDGAPPTSRLRTRGSR